MDGNLKLYPFEINDIVTLRKTHPCGEKRWKVVRLGADIGLECLGCGRKIFLSRRELSSRMKGEAVREVKSEE